jgi:2-polyprenyl-3-methyl-5-hydroxy-6-metoxy-1,4-benzoquinol methylase
MSEAIIELQRLIDEYRGTRGTIRLLEAGCGSMSKVRFGDDVRIVGIDISEKQLERNENLDERILADIQTHSLSERSFDMIICWDVLEHLDNPNKALGNFLRAAKPGGLIVLAFPNLFSLKGIVTKLTPHFVHVWYYRRLLKVPDAGMQDTPPFVTPFKLTATYPAIRRFARKHNASVLYLGFRESPDMQFVRTTYWLMNIVMKSASLATRLLTFGRIDAMHSDCILVLRSDAVT